MIALVCPNRILKSKTRMDPLRLGICCSTRHSSFAFELANRLKRNLAIEALIIADNDALAAETWEQASACSAVLILLDSTTARGPVKRDAWQSLLEHNNEPPVALVRLEACQYPKLLERGSRFLVMTDPLEMARWAERWLVAELLPLSPAGMFCIAGRPTEFPKDWWAQLVDQPGAITTHADLDQAQAFAQQAAAHFDGVCWLACEDTPPDALTAEIEYKAERGRRLLFVLAGATGEVAGALKESRHSFVIVPSFLEKAETNGHPAAAWLGACPQTGFPRILMERLAGDLNDWAHLVIPLTKDGSWIRPALRWESTDEARTRCVKVLEEIFAFRRRWTGICRDLAATCATALRAKFSGELCLDLALFLLDEGRRAEAVAWLRILKTHAVDEELRRRAVKELSWLVDDAGDLLPCVVESGDQLDFGFTGFERPELEELSEQALLAELLASEPNSRKPESTRVRQMRLPIEGMR